MMCQECGCEDKHDVVHMHDGKSHVLNVNKSVMQANDVMAHEIEHYLKDKNIFCINIQGSPGAGKTSVIECIAKSMDPASIAVIQGDLESDIDKVRLEKAGIYTHQINTHSGCHLNAMMINRALHDMKLDGKKYLFIENVGNLVCPAGVKIGQEMNMVISSVTEGSDKPKKYPYIFMDSDIVVVSKYDLAQFVGFDEQQYLNDLKSINGKSAIIKTSTKDQSGFMEVAHLIVHAREHFIGSEHSHMHQSHDEHSHQSQEHHSHEGNDHHSHQDHNHHSH